MKEQKHRYERRQATITRQLNKILDEINGWSFEQLKGNELAHKLFLESTLITTLRSNQRMLELSRINAYRNWAMIDYCELAIRHLKDLSCFNYETWLKRGEWPLEVFDAAMADRAEKNGEQKVFVSFGWVFDQGRGRAGYVRDLEPTEEVEQLVIRMFRNTMKMEYPWMKIEVNRLAMALSFELTLQDPEERGSIERSARVLFRDIIDEVSYVK